MRPDIGVATFNLAMFAKCDGRKLVLRLICIRQLAHQNIPCLPINAKIGKMFLPPNKIVMEKLVTNVTVERQLCDI